jgi:hypothetical protein
VETLLLAGTRMCLLSSDQIHIAMGLGDEVGRMLTALRRSLGAAHLQPQLSPSAPADAQQSAVREPQIVKRTP